MLPTAVSAGCGTKPPGSRSVELDTHTSPAATTTTAPTPSQILTSLRRGWTVPTFSDGVALTVPPRPVRFCSLTRFGSAGAHLDWWGSLRPFPSKNVGRHRATLKF